MRLATTLVLWALALAGAARADGLDLWTGATLSGTAELAPGVEVPARAHPCIACHGWDGSGGGEGSMLAPDLGRGALQARGYDAETFAAALGRGETPGGGDLSRAMPRYHLPAAEVASIWALTEALERRRRIGVDPGTIRLALVHDPALPAAQALVAAYLGAAHGPDITIWGRRIEIAAVRAETDLSAIEVFAVIGPFTPDPAVRAALTAAQVPMLHGFGDASLPGAAFVPLGLDRAEELSALALRASEAGIGPAAVLGGTPEERQEATRALRRTGMLPGRAEAPVQSALILSDMEEVPVNLVPILPRRVLDRRPDLAARPDAVSVDVLPFLDGVADPASAYAKASLDQILEALRAAGPDPTRLGLAEAARSMRRPALGLPRRLHGRRNRVLPWSAP